ncbi:hypothetical protein Ahy_B05g079258 [Arachis hypogaea]|uniref:Ubiquitin-like protease family profile domain-containing protein n=1 Tax=Arachis hypogaea TaxID=3818 RepID=A0A444Z9C6_ARAHY|nr:hypothetical protein Ahy_B05g079258 [Arachis hypogaea]
MLQLARAYDVESNTLKVDAGDIRVTTELIDNVLGIPSRANYLPMAPPSDFGCLKPQKIPLAVSDIEVVARCNKKIPNQEPRNMRRVLYFQCLKHGPLHACQSREPWIAEWTAYELDKKANHVISQVESDVHQAEPVVTDDHEGAQEDHSGHKEASPRTPSSALVQLTEYDFDSEFDVSIVQCPEFKQLLANIEQEQHTMPISMQPLQTVMPKKSCYHTPSPGRPNFSLGLTQLEKTLTPSPIHSIHLRLRNIKKGENKEKQIRAWILNSSLDKEQHLAAYEGQGHLVLQRKDLWTLKARNWVNSTESITRDDNLASFIDGASLVYVGLGPSFGEDNRFFDKVKVVKRKWWLIPNCWRGHWWVYAFEVNAKCLVIIDSLHSVPQDDERDKLDAYVGRQFEDMARIAIPAYVWTIDSPFRSYASTPKQPNNSDYDIYVIKFMKSWTEDRALDEWNEDLLISYRMEFMLDIVCGPQNALVDQVLTLLEDKAEPIRRNQPQNKRKEVRSPFTALSTRTLIERAEGLPNGRIIKGRKK